MGRPRSSLSDYKSLLARRDHIPDITKVYPFLRHSFFEVDHSDALMVIKQRLIAPQVVRTSHHPSGSLSSNWLSEGCGGDWQQVQRVREDNGLSFSPPYLTTTLRTLCRHSSDVQE